MSKLFSLCLQYMLRQIMTLTFLSHNVKFETVHGANPELFLLNSEDEVVEVSTWRGGAG